METELKLTLTAAEFQKLLRQARKPRLRVQRNTYFDDSKLTLRRHGAGLRVRIENGNQAFLTFKQGGGARSGWHQRGEWETKIPLKLARKLGRVKSAWRAKACGPVSRAIARALPDWDLGTARRLGQLRTRRHEFRLGRLVCELDQWSVARKTFYELEVEARNRRAVEKQLRAHFQALGVRYRPGSRTKLAVFFSKARRQR